MSLFTLQAAQNLIDTAFAPWVREMGLKVEKLEEDAACVCMPILHHVCREGGIVSGQAIAALADTAMAFCVWSALGTHKPIATVDLHVTYMRPATGGDLLATATMVKMGRSLAFVRADFTAGNRDVIATAVGTFALPK